MKLLISHAPRVNPPRWPVIILLFVALGELQGVSAYDFSGCCGSKLQHWFDFSDSSVYGTSAQSTISSFSDKLGNSASHTMRGNVEYVPDVQNGLGAMFIDRNTFGCLQFSTSGSWRNPEVIVAYRVVCQQSCNRASGIVVGDVNNGYHFGAYALDEQYIGASHSGGGLLASIYAPYDSWHVANMYFGETDGFMKVDGDESTKETFGITGKYWASSLTKPCLGGYPDHGPMVHYTENYIGEVLIFDSKLTDAERETVTRELMRKWTKPEPFADRAALKAAVDSCLDPTNGDPTGVACCSKPNVDCGVAGKYFEMAEWDVSLVTDMSVLFMNYPVYEQFNADISKWDVSSVTTMYRMFQNCKSFDQDISAWDFSSLTSMEGMFLYAETFNADISGWATGGVLNMHGVFQGAGAFNQPIGSWDVSQATSMFQMFSSARAFNQDLSSWDVSNVEDMMSMFGQAYAFNQDIGSWNTAKVTNMQSMFYNARAFNQDIRSWNTALVTTMLQMFDGARSFNQDIIGWNTASLTVYGDMFTQANAWLAAFDRLDETESTAGPPNEWTALVPCDPSGPIANGAPGPGCTSTLAD